MLTNAQKYCTEYPQSFFTPFLQKLVNKKNFTIHSFLNTFIPILKNHYENYLNGNKTEYILFKKMVTVLFLFNYILPDVDLEQYVEDIKFDYTFLLKCVQCRYEYPIQINKCSKCTCCVFQPIIPFSEKYNAYLNTTYSNEWVVNGEVFGFCNYFKKK